MTQAQRALHLHCPFRGSLSLPCPARVQTGLYLVMSRVAVTAVGLFQTAPQAMAHIRGPLQRTWKQHMGQSRTAQMAVASALISMRLQKIGPKSRHHMTAQYRRELACLHTVVILRLKAPVQDSGLRIAAAISSGTSGLLLQAAGLHYRILLVYFRLPLRAFRLPQLGQVSPRPMTLA